MIANVNVIGRVGRWMAVVALWLVAAAAQATLPIQTWQLDNGAKVLFIENRALPIIDVSVDFPAGYSRDTKAKSGLASMTLYTMRLGAGTLDENAIAERLADTGAQMGTRFDADRAGYNLRTLSSERERNASLELLATVLQEPTFPQAILDREKSRLLAGLKEASSKPESIAERAFYSAVYRDHPYGYRGSGESAAISAFTVQDTQSFYRDFYVSDRAIIAIVGDLAREDADKIARQLTDKLPKSKGPLAPVVPVASLEKAVARNIQHPAQQSHILVGQTGIKRTDPDYFPLFVGNYVLGGGGFASRMVEEVRQKRGLAYSAYSYFSPLAELGVFQIGLQTRKDQAEEALKVVRETVVRYVAEGPTQAELDAAKQNLIGGFPLRIDSNRKIHDYLGLMGFYGLPLDYLDQFVKQIDAVTVEQVRDAFRRRVNPDRMVTVVVGGATKTQ